MDALLVNAHLGLWTETSGGVATLINLSENHSFRIDVPGGERFVLRVHRPGYHSARAIESELQWLRALHAETALPTPRPMPGRNGRELQALQGSGEGRRYAVLFAFEPGVEPTPRDDLGWLFETIGRFAAIAHRHASAFSPAGDFARPVWNAEAIVGAGGLWGDWRRAPDVEGETTRILAALDLRLRRDLADYGQSRHRFGLIHADMRLANLLVDGRSVTLIDFDDCGFGWFMYDFAAAISFYEDDPQAPELRRRWLAGYQAVRPLPTADLMIIDAMVLLRRMALLAWIGSHGETDLARAHANGFARDTARLAARYLEPG